MYLQWSDILCGGIFFEIHKMVSIPSCFLTHTYITITNKKHLKNVGPIRNCELFYIAIHQVSLLSHVACASMSTTTTTTTTTTTRDRGDCYGPMEWAQWTVVQHLIFVCGTWCGTDYVCESIQHQCFSVWNSPTSQHFLKLSKKPHKLTMPTVNVCFVYACHSPTSTGDEAMSASITTSSNSTIHSKKQYTAHIVYIAHT